MGAKTFNSELLYIVFSFRRLLDVDMQHRGSQIQNKAKKIKENFDKIDSINFVTPKITNVPQKALKYVRIPYLKITTF